MDEINWSKIQQAVETIEEGWVKKVVLPGALIYKIPQGKGYTIRIDIKIA